MIISGADTSVKTCITVNTSVQHAFDVFTRGFDGWLAPQSSHREDADEEAIIETRVGGRCYTTQEDGTDGDWLSTWPFH